MINEFINYWSLHIAKTHGWAHNTFSKPVKTPFLEFCICLLGNKRLIMIKVSSRRIFQYWQLPGKMLERKKEGLILKRNYQENKRTPNLFFCMRENIITLTTKFLNIAPCGRNVRSSRKYYLDLSLRGREGRAVFQPEKEQSINTVMLIQGASVHMVMITSEVEQYPFLLTESRQGYLFL